MKGSMSTPTEPRNPLYFLLLIVGVVFAVTAFAYAIMPVLEQKALDAGQTPPPSPFGGALRAYGGIALLVELAVVVVLSIGSMVWDRLRTLQKERKEGTIPPTKAEEKTP
jgi:amino acid transporter